MATIGIDITAFETATPGGIGTSQYETMRALAALDTPHRFILYAATPVVVPYSGRPLDLPWPIRIGHGFGARSNILWMQTGVNRLLREDGVDLFWSPRHLLPFRARGTALVATVQDFWHLHLPDQQPLLNRTLNRLLISRIMKVADHLVTTSQATAGDALRYYHVPPQRLTVVPLAVNSELFRPMPTSAVEEVRMRLGIPERYVLSLDVFNPRKNFNAVLRAYASLPHDLRAGLGIVGVGRRRTTAADADPRAVAASLGVTGQVSLLDDISSDDIVALYSGAMAFAYPSVYEGFGMPILEAMSCGCPVITSDRSSLSEVAGEAALLVDPTDAQALSSAMGALATDHELAARLVRQGFERASEFTWDRTARGMLDVFDAVLESRR